MKLMNADDINMCLCLKESVAFVILSETLSLLGVASL